MIMRHTENPVKETARLECFSDGVFSIAITLLVLDIHVPIAKDNESLMQLLLANWGTYVAFLVGFFTLLVCWINHHYMFEHIRKINGTLILLNGFKLLIVSFTPFATAIISKYIGTVHQQTAISVYALNFFLMGFAMTGIWCYAYRNGLTSSDSPEFLRAVTRLYIFASVLSGAIFVLSFATFWLCLALFGAMFLIFVIPKNMVAFLERRRRRCVLA